MGEFAKGVVDSPPAAKDLDANPAPKVKMSFKDTLKEFLSDPKAEEEKKKPKSKDDVVPYWKLFSRSDAFDKILIFGGLLGACGTGVMMPLFSLLFGQFTDAFGNPGAAFQNTVNQLALNFLYLGLAGFVSSFMQNGCLQLSANRQSNRLRQLYLRSVLRQDIGWFDMQATTGSLLQGLTEDAQLVQSALGDKLGQFVQFSTMFVAGYILAFTQGWSMTLVLMCCLPFMAAVGWFLSRSVTVLTSQANAAYAEANSAAVQTISQIRTVAAYHAQQRHVDSYSVSLEVPLRVGLRQGWIMGGSLGLLQLFMFVSYGVAFLYGGFQVAAGELTGGQVMQVLFSALIGSFALGQAAPLLQYIFRGRVAGARLFKVIERTPPIDSDNTQGQRLETVSGNVELRDVTFTYPTRPEAPVLRKLSLKVPSGHTLALVGESGSGKSSIVGLVERFYDPTLGGVYLDGVDIRKLNLKWFRQQVGLVNQEPTLFQVDIAANIRLGRPGATDEEVEAAARAANAHRFISALPRGYATAVGERGVQLSGGQKQRIAIARALLKNPKVLLLDEATSALDSTSERIVQAALDAAMEGRTTLVVAHRLSTVRNAHAIAVVKSGNIAEIGTHDELLQDPLGAYSHLVKLQLAREGDNEQPQEAVVDEDEELRTNAVAAATDTARATSAHVSSPALTPAGSATLGTAPEPAAGSRLGSLLGLGRKRSGSGKVPAGLGRKRTASSELPVHAPQLGGSRAASAELPLGGKRVSTSLDMPQRDGSGALAKGVVIEDAAAGPDPNTPVYDDEPWDAKSAKVVKRMIAMNKKEWPYALLGTVFSMLNGVMMPLFALLMSNVIIALYLPSPAQIRSEVVYNAGLMFAIGAGAFLGELFRQVGFVTMGQNLARRVRVLLFQSILRQEIGWFDREEHSSGALATRLQTDAVHVRGAVGDVLGLVASNITMLAFGYSFAFYYDWRIALLITGCLPLIVITGMIQMKHDMGLSGKQGDTYEEANRSVTEAFTAVRVVQAYNLQDEVCGLYNSLLDVLVPKYLKASIMLGLGLGASQLSMMGTNAIVIWFGGMEVTSQRATFQEFLSAFLLVLFAAMGLSQAQLGFPDLGKAKGAIARVFPIVDRKSKCDPFDGAGNQPKAISGALALRDVRFAYPSRPGVIVLTHCSLTIPAGHTLAVVGESGCGKSTIVGLVLRFYDPLAGAVLLDDVNLRDLNVAWLRTHIGLVSQEPLLFSGSIRDNILYGAPGASDDALQAAARAANAHEFISSLPDGYNTQVGERGVQLSGGQKQRVAIARAVVKDPRILLLDEATSALDASSERVVQAALDTIMQGRTCVVVAHRLSTIRDAHSIAVLHRGEVVEQGTHDELMELREGAYARLVAAQMRAPTQAQSQRSKIGDSERLKAAKVEGTKADK